MSNTPNLMTNFLNHGHVAIESTKDAFPHDLQDFIARFPMTSRLNVVGDRVAKILPRGAINIQNQVSIVDAYM